MKYNVGDKVIKQSDIELFFNSFWKERHRESAIAVVTEANEQEFTIYRDKGQFDSVLENGHCCGAHEYMVFHQGSGRCFSWASNERYFHLEKDKTEIEKIIRTIGEEKHKKDMDSIERQLVSLREEKKRKEQTYKDDLIINLALIGVSDKEGNNGRD